jgi:hypothetical protein
MEQPLNFTAGCAVSVSNTVSMTAGMTVEADFIDGGALVVFARGGWGKSGRYSVKVSSVLDQIRTE